MLFKILRRRVRGVAIPMEKLSKMQPLLADVHISESPCEVLGRSTTSAWVFSASPGTDIIPRLLDARVTGMAQGGMNITGIEEVDGVLYAQSWWCRVE
jgi:hypothetical protein